jgi:hypothetical protein
VRQSPAIERGFLFPPSLGLPLSRFGMAVALARYALALRTTQATHCVEINTEGRQGVRSESDNPISLSPGRYAMMAAQRHSGR